ncbi:MAG TPA: hypothetical protein VFY48_00180 [Solirubrobacterales bacterium]|nr:hypothetical protein [Solirubrobacterales bacterium]
MSKKTMAIAVAVAAVAAIALPTTAAANWKHHAQEIEQNVSLGLTGNVWFKDALGGVECQITSEIQATTNTTTGHVKTFLPHPTSATSNCKGTGDMAFCQIHDVKADGLFWLFHTVVIGGQAKAQLTMGDITGTLTGAFCPVKAITLKSNANVTVIPDQPFTISTLQPHAQLQATIQLTNNETQTETVSAGGSLALESKDGVPQQKTWSI